MTILAELQHKKTRPPPKPRKNERRRYSARRRREVAIHESGHVFLARYYGIPSFGMIWPHADGWKGKAFNISREALKRLHPNCTAMIGIAGAAAVMINQRIPVGKFREHFASIADWRWIGLANVTTVLSGATDILKRNWTIVLKIAREIIVKCGHCHAMA